MYEEEKKNSFIKDFIIKLLYMFLFLFLFMWLYPAPKVDLSDVEVKAKVDKEELQPLFAGVFNDNINAMKEAAKSYYTVDRLPDTNGKSVKMSLQEMLNKKMVAPFVDANGKSCNASSSYVEVTRISSTEYTMKVNLVCSDKTDYIIETIGCTSVCPGCVATPASTTSTTTKSTTPTPTTKVVYQPAAVTPSTTPTTNNKQEEKPKVEENKTYIYEKEIVTETWELKNSWTTTKKTGDDVRVYDTRTVYGDTVYTTKKHTYGTISWVTNWDNNEDYLLYLNNIPSNAKNIKITSQSKMTSIINSYYTDRQQCNIQMVGYGCPNSNDSGIDYSTNPTVVNASSYSFSVTPNGFYGNKYTVRVTGTAYGTLLDNYIYKLPVKFTVQWQEPNGKEKIKQYKYEYLDKTTSTDRKYSTSSNDTSLLNDGYKLVGTK